MQDLAFPLTERLRRARQLAGMDQTQLAAGLGVARNTVSNYETGRTEPTATVFVRWARTTGASLDWLAEGIELDVNADSGPHVPIWHGHDVRRAS